MTIIFNLMGQVAPAVMSVAVEIATGLK